MSSAGVLMRISLTGLAKSQAIIGLSFSSVANVVGRFFAGFILGQPQNIPSNMSRLLTIGVCGAVNQLFSLATICCVYPRRQSELSRLDTYNFYRVCWAWIGAYKLGLQASQFGVVFLNVTLLFITAVTIICSIVFPLSQKAGEAID